MVLSCWFSFKDPATTESYTYRHTLSLHDALPIFPLPPKGEGPKQEIAAEAAPTRRCRRASLGVRNVQTRGVNTHRGQPVFSFETPFTCTLPTFSFSGPGLPMKASPRLFAAFAALFAFLLPLAALAQERGLEIDIVGGNASALPIAVVPMPYEGSGVAPETDVSAVVGADLARSGQFRTMPVSDMVEKPDPGGQLQVPAWRLLKADFVVRSEEHTYELQSLMRLSY